MTDQPADLPPPRKGVDPEDIRKALEEQARKRPPRPPVNEMPPPIPRLRVMKPANRSRKKK
jgi:hypothetical protein